MKDKVFIDTNIIVYAYDNSAGVKYNQAKEILVDLWKSANGVISTQVLKEFYVTVTQKIPNTLNKEIAAEIISDLLDSPYKKVLIDFGFYQDYRALTLDKSY